MSLLPALLSALLPAGLPDPDALSALLRDLSLAGAVCPLRQTLLDPERPAPRLIAEIKRRSPSRGDLRADLDPAELSALYERHGAAAISVLAAVSLVKPDPLGLARSPVHGRADREPVRTP